MQSWIGTPQQKSTYFGDYKITHASNESSEEIWSHGILTIVYLINRLLSCVIKFQLPLDVLKWRKSNLSHLWVFSYVCYVHHQNLYCDKLNPQVIWCIFLGYSWIKKNMHAMILNLRCYLYNGMWGFLRMNHTFRTMFE